MSIEVDWDEARAIVADAAPVAAPQHVALGDAAGQVTADSVRAARPLPHYDSAAMDGWAVSGDGPWRLGERASLIVTGAVVPSSATAVLPHELGEVRAGTLHGADPRPGHHIRRAGDERAVGELLVASGVRLTPAHLALLAVAGFDGLAVRRAAITFLFTGDEIDASGMPEPGRVRDAFTPILPPLANALGGSVAAVHHLGDDAQAIATSLGADTPILVSTGGTGRSGADTLRAALAAVGGELLFDSVRMRPGHPTLAARLRGGRLLLGLPGNPLAAVLSALSLLPPAIDATSVATPRPLESVRLPSALGAAGRTTLVPVRRYGDTWTPADGIRSHMLTGLTAATAIAVVAPTGAARLLALPW